MTDTAAANGEPSLREAARHAKAGQGVMALGIVRRVLAQPMNEAKWTTTVARAGRLIERLVADYDEATTPWPGLPRPVRIALVGEVTTTWLGQALCAEAWRDGVVLRVVHADYDSAGPAILGGIAQGCQAVVTVPWTRRLDAADDRSREARVADETALWTALWAKARDDGARVVHLGVDAVSPPASPVAGGARPDDDLRARLDAANLAMRLALRTDDVFVDVAQIAADMGRRQFYDARRLAWTRQPWSEAGVAWLSRQLWAALRASLSGPKKVLVLDLDDTLWGGVVGERGGTGVTLGDEPDGAAFVAFQRAVKTLRAQGVVLAVATKNNAADARAPFAEHPQMVLKLSDFAAFEAGWGPKVESLRRIASTLSLGLDSFVFFDDSPFERGHVAMALPEVRVVDVPRDPADYVAALRREACFVTLGTTAEDTGRAAGYAAEAQRQQHRQTLATAEDYLEALNLVATVAPVDARSLPRVAQLVGKTNQFNLTTRRHSAAAIEAMLGIPRAIGLTVTLADRYGEYGLIAVALAYPRPEAPTTLVLDTLLMSCRAIGRTVEHALFGALIDRAGALGFARLAGEYRPTPKNGQVADLLPRWGLHAQGDGFEAPLASLVPPKSWVSVRGPQDS